MYKLLFNFAQIFEQSKLDIPQGEANGNVISVISRIVFALLGATSVLIITIAGFKYVLSQGDPQAVAKAKNTILYAVIGLIVALSGFTIVSFVIGRVG